MSRVSGGQFAALLLITDLFALLCLRGNVTAVTALGFFSGVFLQFLLMLPAVYYYKKGGTLHGAPKPYMWFYMVYIILWGGKLFSMLWRTAGEISIPSENFSFIPEKLLISGLIAVVCLYASSPGIRPIARASVIAVLLGVACISIIAISTAAGGGFEDLAGLNRTEGFFSELSRGFVLSGGLGRFIVLLGYTKTDPMKCAGGYFIGKALLFTAVPLTAAAAVGGITEISEFPVIMAAELSQPFSSQRIDSLFLIIFVITSVFAISVQTAASSFLMNEIFPSFSRFRSTFILALMIGAAFIMSETDEYSPIYVWAALKAAAAVPLLMLLHKGRKRRRC